MATQGVLRQGAPLGRGLNGLAAPVGRRGLRVTRAVPRGPI